MGSLFAITLLGVSSILNGSNVNGLSVEIWEVPVLLPINDTCVSKTFEMAFNDIKDRTIVGEKHLYKLRPTFYETPTSLFQMLDLMDRVHQFTLIVDTEKLRNITKKTTIGPFLMEHIHIFAAVASSIPLVQVSYTPISETSITRVDSRLQLPPSLGEIFRAARRFVIEMGWQNIIIVYDSSNIRYKTSTNNFEEHLTSPGVNETKINIVYKARIRSGLDGINTGDLVRLPGFNTRIVFLLMGVTGVRQVFCQAYHMGLHRSNYVWILLEELAEGWETSAHDTYNAETGEFNREIDCTPEQLLLVSERYIAITYPGLRRDGKVTVSNTTAENLMERLQSEVGPNITCNSSIGYVYDSVWATFLFLQKVILVKGYGNGKWETFETGFFYGNGRPFYGGITEKILNFSFEGVSGPVSYKHETFFGNSISRDGNSSILAIQHGKPTVWVGSYHADSNNLYLTDDAINKLFGMPDIPGDQAVHRFKDYQFPKEYVITIWSLASLGIFITVILSCFIVLYNPSNSHFRTILQWVDAIVCFGCIICLASLIIYGLDTRFIPQSSYGDVCSVFTCMITIGFTLTFGALFAKTWWKYKSFHAPSVNNTKREFSEWFILLLIFVFLVVDIAVLIAWGLMSPITSTLHNPYNTSLITHVEIFRIQKCESKYQNHFLIAIYCYKGLLLVFGLFLAWQTTSQANKGSDTASSGFFKGSSLAIFNTALVSLVGVVCATLLQDTIYRHALFAVLALCVILCTGVTLAMLFIPKVRTTIFRISETDQSSGDDNDNCSIKLKLNKTAFKKFRKRPTCSSFKQPSLSSDVTSQLSISTATSSIDSRKNTVTSSMESETDRSYHAGSFISHNPVIASLSSSPTIHEVPLNEEDNKLSEKPNKERVKLEEGGAEEAVEDYDDVIANQYANAK